MGHGYPKQMIVCFRSGKRKKVDIARKESKMPNFNIYRKSGHAGKYTRYSNRRVLIVSRSGQIRIPRKLWEEELEGAPALQCGYDPDGDFLGVHPAEHVSSDSFKVAGAEDTQSKGTVGIGSEKFIREDCGLTLDGRDRVYECRPLHDRWLFVDLGSKATLIGMKTKTS